jgi:mannose-6-phosphate isomerase-like protein (cupin superfamily)
MIAQGRLFHMSHKFRRIITGHNAAGKSVISIDDGPAVNMQDALLEIWHTDGESVDSRETADRGLGPVLLSPPKNGVKFRWFVVPPIDPNTSEDDMRAYFDDAFASIGAAGDRPDTSRNPGMHKTKTVDYIILLSGRAKLVLDEDETDLEPMDVVVQRGTNHAWVCTGTEPAVFCAVLIDADVI